MTRRIAISVGHGQKIRGASASPNPDPYNDEVNECVKIVDRVHALLTEHGHACVKFFDTVSTSQSQNLDRIVSWHNSQSRDLDVSCHLNANAKTSNPMGCEVLYVTQENLAEQVSAAIAAAGHFKDRGEKYRGDLAFLNGTSKPAILLECWFCDSSADCANAKKYHDEICQAIAEKIADVDLDDIPEQPPKPEQPPEPTEPPSGENMVEISGNVTGHVTIYINGTLVTGHEPCEHAVNMTIKKTGNVIVLIQGEEFHQDPPQTDS